MVELKKELPEIFEEFAEQRKNSFLAIKEVKEKEIPVVGVFCTYLPREIPNAMGAAVVGYVPYQMKQFQMQKKICQEIYVH